MKHGHASGVRPTREYHTWTGIKDRCLNKRSRQYRRYGGRGIKVCARWKHSFANFLSDMGKKPKGSSIERKNNNKGYNPSNCIWADMKKQNNNRSDNDRVAFAGMNLTVSQWSQAAGLSRSCLVWRLKAGLPFALALAKPVSYDSYWKRKLLKLIRNNSLRKLL